MTLSEILNRAPGKITKGRCLRCNRIYLWPLGRLRVKDATCDGCGNGLANTLHYNRSAAVSFLAEYASETRNIARMDS
tara:strand:+ start:799 stop:1032 length:234 start_codon:yes stop_codon:yes gene_type:complete